MQRCECAIIMNKLKGTPVVPVFVADATKNGDVTTFLKFEMSNLNPSNFPNASHARGKDTQLIVNKLWYVYFNCTQQYNNFFSDSKSLPKGETEFLNSIAGTMDQVSHFSLFPFSLLKSLTEVIYENFMAIN